MRKITLLLALLTIIFSWQANAQITSFPYSEDFESGDGGWTVDAASTASTWTLGTPAGTVINSADSGANSWVTNLTGNYNASESSAVISPVFDFTALLAPAIELNVWWNSEFSWDGAVLQSSIDGGTTWVNVGAVGDPNNWFTDDTIGGAPGGQPEGWTGRGVANGSGDWVTARHALTGLAGEANVLLRVAFGSDFTVQDEGFAFDTVTIFEVTCPEPSAIVVDATGSDNVTLSWTAGGGEGAWEVAIQTAGTGTPTGNGADATSNTAYNEAGLTPASDYEVYVRSNCGGEFSPWVGPVNFATECVTFTAPYTEGFENGGDIPLCWSMSGGEDWNFDDETGFNHIGDDGTITGSTNTNGYFAWVDASGTQDPAVLLSPLVDVSGLTTPALSFFEISNNEGDANAQLDVEVWDGAAWNLMATYNTNTAGWELKVIDLSTLTITGDVQARFTFSEVIAPGDFTDDIAIDDVTFDEAPSCFAPSSLTASAITAFEAELSWMQDGTVSMWNIELVTSGTPATGTPTNTDVTNPFTATGLTAVTSYDYYVQANCGADGLSDWTGPFTFTTECDVFIPDYLEDFTDIPADCWEEAAEGDATTGPQNFGAGDWNPDGFLNNGTSGAYKINLWVANKSDWIVSPSFDLTGGPHQVEFDFGVMQFGSSTNAGTLGSDDTVQLFITTDNGTTWTSLLTYDSTSVIPVTGLHPVIDLTAYANQTVRFAILGSEGTVDDPEDNDVFVDNFQVRNIPTCAEPSDLTSNNLSLTSTEIGWTENGGQSLWNIEYGPEGFTPGTGTLINDVTTNPYTITGLMPDTSYDFYVQTNCDADGLSSWTGPGNFFSGYCESIPTSHDGQGITSVTIGVTDFTGLGGQDINGDDITYQSLLTPVVNVFQGVETSVTIVMETGFTYDTVLWIDFNDNLVFEDSEIVYTGVSTNDNPTVLDATFTMPADAAIGEHRMRLGSADFGQNPPNPCFGGSFGVTLDFTVNVQVLDCVLPEATFTLAPDCDNNQFFIDIDVSSLGDATSLIISNDLDANTVPVPATGMYQAGPFAFGSSVKAILTNEQNGNCVISSTTYSLSACPPDNDEPCFATLAVVNPDESCDSTTPGTILEATASSVPGGSCTGVADDDVWFEFTAVGTQQLISLENIAGGTFNLDHAVYEGTCDGLTELYCSDQTNSLTPELTIGDTYYIRVFSGGAGSETTTFDLCIGTLGVPTYCLDALPICADPDLEYPSTVGDQTAPDYIDYDCLGSEPDPQWNTIFFDESGDYQFTLSQTNAAGNGLDIDFIVWGPFNDQDGACVDLLPENVADCSYSATAVETINLNGVSAGDVYVILITNFSQQEGTYIFSQDSGPPDGTNCEIVCDAELAYDGTVVPQNPDAPEFTPDETIDLCGVTSVELSANSPYATNYEWYFNGVANGETTETITATESGTYQVFAFGGICEDVTFSSVAELNFYDDAVANPAMDLEACDQDGDGLENFDLEAQTATILGTQSPTDFTVTYYASLNDAQTANMPLTSPYSAADGTIIYVRVEDTDAVGSMSGCATTNTTFNLVVSNTPTSMQAPDLELCDDGDGMVDFDLTQNEATIVDGQTGVIITYHTSMEDADSGDNDITTPAAYQNTMNTETIFVRVEDSTTGCYTTTTFDLILSPKPPLTQADNLQGCDNDNDNDAIYDLTENEAVISNGQTGLTFTYHLSQSDADTNTDAITSPTDYESSPVTIFVRAETADGCFETTSFDLEIGIAPISSFDSMIDYEVCPNATVPIEVTAIADNYTEDEVSIQWLYEGDPITGANELVLDTVLLSGTYTIEVTFNDTGCFDSADIFVDELENCTIPQGISPNNDTFNDTFDLSSFDVQSLEIFNRNGTKVYSKTNYTNEWYGQSNDGDELPVGTYFYVMKYQGDKVKSAWVYINREN